MLGNRHRVNESVQFSSHGGSGGGGGEGVDGDLLPTNSIGQNLDDNTRRRDQESIIRFCSNGTVEKNTDGVITRRNPGNNLAVGFTGLRSNVSRRIGFRVVFTMQVLNPVTGASLWRGNLFMPQPFETQIA